MKLIIISGAPASGKTSTARKIADLSGYTLLSKDANIERLYDIDDHKQGFFSYNKKAKKMLADQLVGCVNSEKSVIIESNFLKSDIILPESIEMNNSLELMEIFCTTKGFLRLKRFIARNKKNSRHKVYSDKKFYATTFLECFLNYLGIEWPYKPTAITDKLYILNTKDFSKIDWEEIKFFIGY